MDAWAAGKPFPPTYGSPDTPGTGAVGMREYGTSLPWLVNRVPRLVRSRGMRFTREKQEESMKKQEQASNGGRQDIR
jgi:hypothetical protein